VTVSDTEVLIAFYSLGNVKKPRGTLHDEKKKVIPTNDEITLSTDKLAQASIVTLDSPFKKTILFPNTGPGIATRTDSRIIFLRKPLPKALIDLLPADLGEPLAMDAKVWEREGYREGFSIPTTSITRYRRYSDGIVLTFLFNGKRQKLTLQSKSIRDI